MTRKKTKHCLSRPNKTLKVSSQLRNIRIFGQNKMKNLDYPSPHFNIETSSGLPRKSSQSSGIFGHLRKFSENVRERSSGTILKNLRKSSEGGRKSSENHQKRHQHVYIIKKNITRRLEDINFIFSWQKYIDYYMLRA